MDSATVIGERDMQAKIADMRLFLKACEWTGYMLDEQIELLNLALDALEKPSIPIAWIEDYANRIRKERDKHQFRSKRYEELDCDALLIDRVVEEYLAEAVKDGR